MPRENELSNGAQMVRSELLAAASGQRSWKVVYTRSKVRSQGPLNRYGAILELGVMMLLIILSFPFRFRRCCKSMSLDLTKICYSHGERIRTGGV
jgi:hypothetical protein